MTIVTQQDFSYRLIGSDADSAREAGMDVDGGASRLATAISLGCPEEDLVVVEAMPDTVMYALLHADVERNGLIGGLGATEMKQFRCDLTRMNGNLRSISSRKWLQEVFDLAGVEELAAEFRKLPTKKNLYPIVFDIGENLFIGTAELVQTN